MGMASAWLIYIPSFCTAVTTVSDKGTPCRKKHSFGKMVAGVSAHGNRLFTGSQSEARTGAGFHLPRPTLKGLFLPPPHLQKALQPVIEPQGGRQAFQK